ncbi:MAG: T9SS type A sorting domain-containing protein [Calditrichaeota bacterium]|nr:T9SS type A sorting domain-containing protein [Calditrichota bacterium]
MFKKITFFVLLTSFLFAQDFSGIKIYVNPGHGGHDPANDRYIPATGFWESEGNLTKGLYLMELLKKHNATVFISRTQNRDQDDLPLSQIDADANAKNVDYFQSIHSNAHNATVNYPLVLFRGYDNDPVFPNAKKMGGIIWGEMDKLDGQWTYWKYSFDNVRGDWSFYPQWGTSGLGVLRYLTMPGTLTEGSFHDYIPNSFRLMSLDYRRHESIVLLRSFIQYFGLDQLPDGVVAGIVRSKTENVDYSYNYNSGLPNDKKKALNNARVRLLPDNRVYVTDFHKNGFFMFENVKPGTYQVVMDAGDYAGDTVQVVVKANRTSFANGFLLKVADKAPEVYTYSPANNDSSVATHSDIRIYFSQQMDRESTENAFSTNPPTNGYFSWQNSDMTMIYSLYDTLSRSTEYEVKIDSSAKNKKGKHLKEPYAFTFKTSSYHVIPRVVSFAPAADSIRTNSTISVSFDAPMRIAETEAAFSVDPPLSGHFEWEEDLTGFTFVPDSLMKRKTLYTVTLSDEAQNFYGVHIDSALQFSFLTRYLNELLMLKSFPRNGQTEVSTRLQIFVVFSGVPNKYTVFDNFQISDSSGNLISYRGLDVFEKEGRGVLVFEPRQPLKKNMRYTIRFFPGIEDMEKLALPDTLTINFKTTLEGYGGGKVLDDFETNFGWTDPDNNADTQGTNPDGTNFDITRTKKVNGTYSGRLEYSFKVDSGGVCRLPNEERIRIPVSGGTNFGIWIYGDFSHNLLELWFDRDNKTDVVAFSDTIDWAGWKLITIPLDSIAGSGKIFFQSVVIRQNKEGYRDGAVYLDDVQYDVTFTDIEDQPLTNVPAKFLLYQNYPNPFNPLTTIRYELPKTGMVELSLFNILGQKVKELVKGTQTAGLHEIKLNAGNLASGIYLYRLKMDDRIQIRKLVVLK